jgi:hypothetical protein
VVTLQALELNVSPVTVTRKSPAPVAPLPGPVAPKVSVSDPPPRNVPVTSMPSISAPVVWNPDSAAVEKPVPGLVLTVTLAAWAESGASRSAPARAA